MTALKEFRIKNHLQAKEIAEFLGVSKGFISRIESGIDSLPATQLRKLINNEQGWDTTDLQETPSITPITASAENGGIAIAANGPVRQSLPGKMSVRVAMLEAENSLLKSDIKKLQDMLTEERNRSERYLKMMENLTLKK